MIVPMEDADPMPGPLRVHPTNDRCFADGELKFDLTRFNEVFFARLRGYLVYAGADPSVVPALPAGAGPFDVRWLNCGTGRWVAGEPLGQTDCRIALHAPFREHGVLHLRCDS